MEKVIIFTVAALMVLAQILVVVLGLGGLISLATQPIMSSQVEAAPLTPTEECQRYMKEHHLSGSIEQCLAYKAAEEEEEDRRAEFERDKAGEQQAETDSSY